MAEIEIFKLFLLVMVRVSGLVVSAPVIGSRNTPAIAKIGLAALTALLITPILPALSESIPEEPMSFAVMALGEFLIGLIIGFVAVVFFSAIQIAGQVVDIQAGFGMMNVFNPAMETQYPIFGFFLYIVAVLLFLVTGGHRVLIWALFCTYRHIPLGGFAVRPELLFEVSRWGGAIFIDGVMIAAPVATAMLLAYICMGLLGRVVPQIHLFVVGFPVTIGTSLFLIGLTLGVYARLLDGMFNRMFHDVERLIESIG